MSKPQPKNESVLWADWPLKPRQPGVYFGMRENLYHRGDSSLGSSDLLRLSRNPSDYWFTSWMNPRRKPDQDTPATIRGTAVHVLVLYGEQEFSRRYMRGPDQDGLTSGEKAASTKTANIDAAKRNKICLPAETYDNVAIAGAMLAKNPKLANALVGGLNEVSVFWVDQRTGIPKKARFDCLKPRGIGDLKSLANKYSKNFATACIDSVRWDRRDVQAKHYMDARAQIARFEAEGLVFGSPGEEALATWATWKQIVASKSWAWAWVWWQAEGAPITYSRVVSPANPIFEVSAATIEKAQQNFLDYHERFGTNEIWLLEEDPTELFIDELGPYFGRE